MAYTSSFTSSTTSSTSRSTTTSSATEQSSTTDSLAASFTIEESSLDGSDGLAGALGGDAIALGDDTLTYGSITGEAEADGPVSELGGTASMTSSAEASAGEEVYVAADTFGYVSDGAELVFTFTADSTSTSQDPDGSEATASSTTSISAINIEPTSYEDYGSYEPVVSTEAEITIDDAQITIDEAETNLDGNLAVLEFDAQAYGEDTYLTMDAYTLAIEDELSLTAGYLEFAVG